MPSITKVWLDESENECTMCGACEATCPEVFEVPEKMVVRPDAQLALTDQVVEAAEGCPVGTIAIEYDGSGKRDNPM
jgi:ferredoxin